jgi:hypothetical protein
MTLAADRDLDNQQFAIEDITTGLHASGFGQVGDGRPFSFHVEKQVLVVEIYRPRIDLTDERSVAAAVRDAVADAQPVPRTAR